MDRRNRPVGRLYFVTPEYNYGPAAALKNDWVYPEWNRKTASFVSYGGAAGGVQQLRETAIELDAFAVAAPP
jgi:NAD(P)H-dependent FMN reductase